MIEDIEPFPDEDPLEPEIVVRRVDEEPEERPGGRFGRFIPKMSETTARVVVAIPWARGPEGFAVPDEIRELLDG